MKQEYDFSKAKRGRFFPENTTLTFPAPDEKPGWLGSTGEIAEFIDEEAKKTLDSYRAFNHA